jgi:hypothetical protein
VATPVRILNAPVERVGDEDLVARADRDVMRLAVFAERLALPRTFDFADDVAVQVELHDLADVAVCEPDVLVRPHAQAARGARVLRLADVAAVRIEHLDARVVAVGDVEQPLVVGDERMRQVEVARPAPLPVPGLDIIAIGAELVHTGLRLAVPLQHVDLARRTDHRLVRLMKQA